MQGMDIILTCQGGDYTNEVPSPRATERESERARGEKGEVQRERQREKEREREREREIERQRDREREPVGGERRLGDPALLGAAGS